MKFDNFELKSCLGPFKASLDEKDRLKIIFLRIASFFKDIWI